MLIGAHSATADAHWAAGAWCVTSNSQHEHCNYNTRCLTFEAATSNDVFFQALKPTA